jgi:hypothetical protein
MADNAIKSASFQSLSGTRRHVGAEGATQRRDCGCSNAQTDDKNPQGCQPAASYHSPAYQPGKIDASIRLSLEAEQTARNALAEVREAVSGDCARGVNRTGAALPAYASFLELPAFRVFRTPCLALFTVAAVELRHGFSPENWENHKIHCTLGEGRSCKLLIQIWGG